ncbi:MAG: TraR/DksA family transcriptional regulator [Planctomycetaceae bacterium]|nr:TraR/DksA family transcriptional regulator [Planctomycetaceae bacterium]
MTKRDLSTIKRKLENQLSDLEDRAQRIELRLSDPGSPDWEENALVHEDDEVLNVLSEKVEDDIHEIRLALKRIDEGTYGSCVRCHAPISLQRLEALPFTASCITCAGHG